MRRLYLAFFLVLLAVPARADFAEAVAKLAFGESDERVAAIGEIAASGDARARVVLEALTAGDLQTAGKRVRIVKDSAAVDAATGAPVKPLPTEREDVVANNRLRGAVQAALGGLSLSSPDAAARLAAARELATGADASMLPLVKNALKSESDAEVRALLEEIGATLELKSEDKPARLAAVRALARSSNPNARMLLVSALESEKDEELRMKCAWR